MKRPSNSIAFELSVTSRDDGGIGVDESLMGGQTDRRHPAGERVPLEPVEVGPVCGRERLFFRQVHLPVQKVHTLDAEGRGLFDHGLD